VRLRRKTWRASRLDGRGLVSWKAGQPGDGQYATHRLRDQLCDSVGLIVGKLAIRREHGSVNVIQRREGIMVHLDNP